MSEDFTVTPVPIPAAPLPAAVPAQAPLKISGPEHEVQGVLYKICQDTKRVFMKVGQTFQHVGVDAETFLKQHGLPALPVKPAAPEPTAQTTFDPSDKKKS